MAKFTYVALFVFLHTALAVKVKVVMHSEQEDSKIEDEESRTEPWVRKRIEVSKPLLKRHKHEENVEDEEPRTESWGHKRVEVTMPFLKRHKVEENIEYELEDKNEEPRTESWHHKKRLSKTRNKHADKIEYEDDKPTTQKPRVLHPNDMIFPLIYRQNHINSMFKFGEVWYTWSIEKRTDGSKAIDYYICHDDPKRCDEVGWERTDSLPKCAFEIDSVIADDRACVNSFGVEPHQGSCDGAEQMKVSDIVRACGPRIRSLWRFQRVGRRPANAAKPADVNSLLCEDEEECFLSLEYRIHHDRITFSLHEPTRGQTFKSVLKRDANEEKVTPAEPRHAHKNKKHEEKFHLRKKTEGKGSVKERNDSDLNRRAVKNKIKTQDDVSDDFSE